MDRKQGKMILTVLTLNESPRLRWRKILREYFRFSGDWTIYALPPCIILAEGNHFDDDIDIGNGIYSFSAEPCWTGRFSILPITGGNIPPFSENPGLFTSMRKTSHEFPSIEISVDGAMLLEAENEAFRILRFRHLRKDRDS